MGCIEILGGQKLTGTVRIQGSKNAVLPILAGTVLHSGITTLHNCPRIRDVLCMVSILEELGCETAWRENTLTIDSRNVMTYEVPKGLGAEMRSSIILMGSLLGRMGKAEIPYPGGCTIGARPIDLHLKAMKALGAQIQEQEGRLSAAAKKLSGNVIEFHFPSVGATENAILGAVFAEGVTEIKNCAKEPEIQELCRFLKEKGARIQGEGTSHIRIWGVERLSDSSFTLVSDRIVAGTYMMAAAAVRGNVLLEHVPVDQMEAVLGALKEMGVKFTPEGQGLRVNAEKAGRPLEWIETNPYPGFPTDLQSQLMAVLSLAEGESHIRERLFEARFKVTSALNQMGARITLEGREARIQGVEQLEGRAVEAWELRGGAALAIAGLAAQGKTRISNSHYIERGYEDISGDLRKLGGLVYRTPY